LTELLRQRGAPVAASAPRPGSALPLPAGLGDQLSAFPALVRGQQLALASAKVRGTDPDTPRGLTKVTPTH
ncbi:MAG: glutamine--fructose-6-phosphate aminotransferase, partial [Actinomycetota bacterium]|nr:glutamine--fructose-6-phosphate aminotransferase [Actinomycetota bacterium]